MKIVRRLLPMSRAGMALWAWRHRDQLADTALFVARAAPRAMQGHGRARSDALAEARLRARLLGRSVTRDAGLSVEVRDGVARISGSVSEAARVAAVDAAEATAGIDDVMDLTEVPRKRRMAAR